MSKSIYIFLIFSIIISAAIILFWGLGNVDLDGNEDIYVSDSVGYLRHDPFMAPRQHLRKPHYPASPHPFFTQLLTAEVFRLFGLSLYTARLTQAIATFITICTTMLLAWILFRSPYTVIAVGLVLTTLPLSIRYGRMAVLDPVLMCEQTLGMLWVYLATRSAKQRGYLFTILTGIALGLSISTKLTGIFFFVPLTLWFMWQYIQEKNSYFLKAFALLIVSASFTFILFTDPYSYVYGWTHFSDPKYKNISLLGTLMSFTKLQYWYYFIISLTGVIPFLLLLFAVYCTHNPFKNPRWIFILLWILGPLIYLFINPPHVTGLSSEWAYLPLVPPLALILGMALTKISTYFKQKFKIPQLILYGLYTVLITPNLINYGLRFQPMPLSNYIKARNVINGNLAVLKVIQTLNLDTQPVTALLVIRGVDVPVWLLNSNITTEPKYHELDFYNYVITDNTELVKQVLSHHFQVAVKLKNPSEPAIVLLRRE